LEETKVATPKAKLIDVSEIRKAPRGRKPQTDQDLLDLFKQVKPGMAIVLDDVFGNVAKAERGKVSQTVRTHWKMVHDTKPSLNFSEDGILQVSHAKTNEAE
jgi:hypothetical protein